MISREKKQPFQLWFDGKFVKSVKSIQIQQK